MPGMSASVSSSILVMENPSPTFSRVTFAPVWTRVGARPARESCAVSAIVKHPAWAAPISSSGLVAAWPSSNRDLNEYGPSNAPLPTFNRPLPSARLPFHSASAFRVGIKSPFENALDHERALLLQLGMRRLNHRDEQRCRERKVHHECIQFGHVVIVDIARPASEVTERHHEEHGDDRVEDHVCCIRKHSPAPAGAERTNITNGESSASKW